MFSEEEIREVNEKVNPAPKVEPQNQVVVKIDESGIMNFSNQQELGNAARLVIAMRLAPQSLRNEGVEVVMSALIFCKQHALPFDAMNEIGVIKGKVAPFGSLKTALAERHPDYGEMDIFYVDKDMNKISFENKNLAAEVYACVIQSKKKGSERWVEFFFTVDEAKQAGLLTNNTKSDASWVKYTKDLLFHKAKNRCLDAQYASALKGVKSYEELYYEEKSRDVLPNINDRLKEIREQNEPTPASDDLHK